MSPRENIRASTRVFRRNRTAICTSATRKALPELWHRARIWRHLQPAHGRYKSDEGRDRIRREHSGPTVNWLIADWAEDRLGLKPQGKTPETISGDGKRDFYQPPIFGTSEAERKNSTIPFEPFYASDYFGQIYDYAEQLIEKRQSVRLRSFGGGPGIVSRRARSSRPGFAVSQPFQRGKSRSVSAHESRGISRRRPHAACED